MNHGAGKDKAMGNTKEHAEAMIERHAGEKGLKNYRATIGKTVQQEALF